MGAPELEILKPIDPSITNCDDYEVFTLTNAHVSHVRNGKPASLLTAYADTPLKVEGRLEAPDRHQQKYLVKKPFKPVDIEIKGVTRFSYGQTEDREVVIWALGEAGWFELRPAKSYQDIYEEMVQAVEVLYFITDIYNEPRKRGGGPNAPLIFQEYVEDERFACDTPEHAARIFHKHKNFLIMCFLNRAQGLSWMNTPIGRYYKTHFQKDYENAKARIEGEVATKDVGVSKAESAPQKSRTSKVKEQAKTTANAPKKDSNWWEAAAIFEFMQKAVNQGAMHRGRVTIDRVAKLMVKRYEIDDVDIATSVIIAHATNLRYMIERPRRKNVELFVDEPIHQQLSSSHSLSAAEIRRAESIELRPRRDRPNLRDDASNDSDSSSSMETPQQRSKGNKPRLSVLRPKSGRYSGKGKSIKRGKGKSKMPTAHIATDDESDDSEELENNSDSDTATDNPTQVLSPGKRKHVPDATEPRSRKRAASESASIEPDSPPPSSSSEDTSANALPLRWRSTVVTGTGKLQSRSLVPPIVSSPLPTFTANGPRDSWICTFDGCSQKIYGASTDTGRMLFKEHLEDHSKGRQEQVGLVMREEEKLRLPVNHLIKRIREMADQQRSLFPVADPGSPALRPRPIERSL